MIYNVQDLNAGMILPEAKIEVKQRNIELYAEASRDFNPIHIDPEFAKNTELGGTVAHGMLVLAYISSYMTANFGKNWLTGGFLDVRFKTAARPGDILGIGVQIKEIKTMDRCTSVYCDILCRNQNNETIITGEAKITI